MHSSGKTAIFFRIFFKKVRKYGQKSAFFWLKIFKKCHFYRILGGRFFRQKNDPTFSVYFSAPRQKKYGGVLDPFWPILVHFST